MNPALPLPVPALASSRPYSPPRGRCPVDLRLDGNEGPRPLAELFETLVAAGPQLLQRYPDRSGLEARLAKALGLEAGQVLVTAGGDEAIDRICRTYLDASRNLVATAPTFEMIPRYAELAGAEVRRTDWPGGAFPAGEVLDLVDGQTGVIAVVSPNNPTGAVASPEDLRRIAAAAPGALLLVDLAYAEFADEDLTPVALDLPNALIVRSLSKAWGLAGLRVGYAAGPAGLIAPLRAAGGPYAVAAPSLRLAEAALDRPETVTEAVQRIRVERDRLGELLTELEADVLPSQGNFVYGRFAQAAWVRDALAGLGIGVRLFADEQQAGCLRISCPGDEADFTRLESALRCVLAPDALLLDMDGVLADVSRSYRRAILETVSAFGATTDDEAISAAKRRTGSNNDWVVTHELLSRRGVQVSLDDVIARFQEIYAEANSSERLIPDATELRELARRLPLGIVTGRPRAEAETFLERAGLTGMFGALVCMEDAPDKPDPAPVRLALERLGARSAWMVGDTVNDIAAARASGVVPLGVVPPGEDPLTYPDVLTAAGAGRILGRLAELLEVLP